MSSNNTSEGSKDPIDAALIAFRKAWHSGEHPDPELFCQSYPECGPELLDRINNFLLIAEGLESPAPIGDKGMAEEELASSKILGDFRIIRELGRGGMGTVYEAEQISLKRKVALKVLPSHLSFSDDAVQKFHREAEAGGRQTHPVIVAIHAIGEHEGIHYIAQELVEGGITLNDKLDELRQTGKQPSGYFRKAAFLISEVADALQHAHVSGVIHRDIKPSNILLSGEWNPKVTDFGLARVEDALALSRTGDFAGTPYYMSPEQAMSKRIGIDRRTDIYSLGVTLYEMLTLRRPFEGHTSHEILKNIMLMDPLDPHKANSKVPRDLSVICMKAMEKLPAKRYQSMEEFGDDLKRFLHGDVILAKPAGLGTRAWKRIKRNPVISGAVSLALVAVVVFAVVVPWVIAQKEKENAKLLEAERNRAIAAKNEAEEQRKIAEARFEEVIRLSDVKHLTNLETDSERLWPALPENIPELKSWLERAYTLVDRLDDHRATLAVLRERALKTDLDQEDSKNRTRNFEDTETQWQHDTLAGLISGMEDLLDEERGLLKDVEGRLRFAETVKKRSIDDHREAWDEVCEWVAEDELYGGLQLKPQLGLVPIGYDSRSGLWEFVHLASGEAPRPGLNGKLILTEETGLVFVLIPGGIFNMGAVKPSEGNPEGSPNVDPEAGSAEGPVHKVTVKSFFISKYEMTQGQWLRFTKKNPSSYQSGHFVGDKPLKLANLLHPVENISWEDCNQVLFRLNLRLPTEAEWEYVARAGTTTVWWTGNDKESLKGVANLCDINFKNNGQGGRAYEEWLDDGYTTHAPVGIYRPNYFGLHDVCGNVWEWCQDTFLTYKNRAPDGSGGSAFEDMGSPLRVINLKVVRGGCWFSTAFLCRSAYRFWRYPTYQSDFAGVRPACSIQE
jgi:formylglycine-generating enzyme required for sulfatase activity